MARVPISFTGRVKGGPARGGLGRECRFYTDDTLGVAKTLFRREAGGGLQPVVIIPNAGIARALAANRGAGDAFVTVAIGQTGSFNVGDLIPIWNAVQGTVYRVITAINAGTGQIDVDSALGIAFTVANGTQVNATDMEGHTWGWADDATATWMQVKELGSNRLLAPVKVANAAPALAIAVQEEGVAVNSRATLNFIGPNLTAVDNPGNARIDVTETAAPRAATYVVGAEDATLTAELVLGTAVIMEGTLGTRPAASLAGRLYITTDEAGGRRVYRDTGSAWNQIAHGVLQAITDAMHGVLTIANAHGFAQISGAITTAQHGALGALANAHALGDITSGNAHAARHNAGGADVMAIDAAVGTGSLRTLGTGALQAAVGSHTHTAVHIEAKATAGSAESESVTWTSSFGATPVTVVGKLSVPSNPQGTAHSTVVSTTGATLRNLTSVGSGGQIDVKWAIAMAAT